MKCDFTRSGKPVGGKTRYRCQNCGAIVLSKYDGRHIHRNCTAKQQFGFGDFIERAIAAMGLKPCARLYEWITGRSCGCKKRKAWLNKWIRFPAAYRKT